MSLFSSRLAAKRWVLSFILMATPFSVYAAEDSTSGAEQSIATSQQITDLDQLLDRVRSRQVEERQINQKREQQFLQAKGEQEALLKQARRDFHRSQKQNNPLLKKTESNTKKIKQLQKQLKEETRNLGDIHSIYNEFAGDISAVLQQSLISAQLPERNKQLQKLSDLDRQATIREMESLWLALQQEMTEGGKIKRFDTPVVNPDGRTQSRSVTRIGPFTAISRAPESPQEEARLLRYIPETNELLDLHKQPPHSLRQQASAFIEEQNDSAPLLAVIDPSRGQLLGTLSHSPTLQERIAQGGMIGTIIIVLGALGVLLVIWRVLYLGWIYIRIRLQLRTPGKPKANNPLGRVISASHGLDNTEAAQGDREELMQYKLDEAILTEIPRLERSHSFIKLLAATSPLLGLLGTVTGMILTFQAISLYGSGDPKLMAAGISQALVTTVLGLVVAVPLLFGHNLVAALARSLIQRLDEQSAGVMAQLLERSPEQGSRG